MASNSKTQIIIAIVASIGAMGGSAIANWDKLFPKPPAPVVPATAPAPTINQSISGNNNTQISGSNNVINNGTSNTPVIHENLGKRLHAIYKNGLQSRFGDSPLTRTDEGLIYDYEKPEVQIRFMAKPDDTSILIARIWLSEFNRWQDRNVAECKGEKKKVSVALKNNSDCIESNPAYDCVIARCE